MACRKEGLNESKVVSGTGEKEKKDGKLCVCGTLSLFLNLLAMKRLKAVQVAVCS